MIVEFSSVSYAYDGARMLGAGQRKSTSSDGRGFGGDAAKEAKARRWGNDPDHRWALRDVSFRLEAGEFLGIAGHTGSGKSTLLLALAGLIEPAEGTVVVSGDGREARPPQKAQGEIGIVFQYPEHQLFAPTVIEDVSFGPRNLGCDEDEARDRALRALERVGLDGEAIADRSPFQLSGGQQRRVALAGVLAMEPAVLAMDEPAAGLDPRGRHELLDLVTSLHDQGISCVMISHSMADLAALADRILVLNAGRVVAHDSPERIFGDIEGLAAIGLGAPPAVTLAARLRAAGFPLHEGLYSESALIADLIALGAAAKGKSSAGPSAVIESAESR